MTQFCIAYCGILAKHTLCATNTTGNMIKDATGLEVSLFLSHEHGGCQQIGTRISYNEIDMVLFFTAPGNPDYEEDLHYICRLCDENNVPIATNIGTAEMLVQGLARGSGLAEHNVPQKFPESALINRFSWPPFSRKGGFLLPKLPLDEPGNYGYNSKCMNCGEDA